MLHAFLTLKTFAYVTLQKGRDAIALSDRMKRERPRDARSYLGGWKGYLIEREFEEAVSLLEEAAVAVSDPGEQASLHEMLDEYDVNYLNHQLGLGEKEVALWRERAGQALAKLGWPGPRDPEARDTIRLAAVETMLKRGDGAAATAMAATIQSPGAVMKMVVRRRFDDVLSPSLDRRHLIRSALMQEDKLSLEALAAAPEDPKAVLRRLSFLRSVGREAEVLPLVQPIISDMDKVAQSGTDAFWIVDETADALISLGRGRDAAELTSRLLTLDMDAYRDLISMSINHGARLNRAGMHEAAFHHASTIEKTQAKYATEYGRMWMAETIVCALAAQGRTGEAGNWLERLKDKSDENKAAAMRALLCVNDLDTAEQVLLKRLSADDPGGTLMVIQEYEISGKPSALAPLVAARWDVLLQRPRVKAAIEKVGRIISIPAAGAYWAGS